MVLAVVVMPVTTVNDDMLVIDSSTATEVKDMLLRLQVETGGLALQDNRAVAAADTRRYLGEYACHYLGVSSGYC